MAKIKVKRYLENKNMSEIYQKVDMRFAFLSSPKDGYRQCHQFAKCRDFLQDAVKSDINKSNCSIYSFVYRSGYNPPIDLRKMRMLVQKGSESDNIFNNSMKRAKKLLNHYENLAGWGKSRVSKIEDEPHLRLFNGPSDWIKSSFLVSMYTFVIRLGAKDIGTFKSNDELVAIYKKIKDVGHVGHVGRTDNDIIYLRRCFDKLHLVVKHADALFNKDIKRNYPHNVHIDPFHSTGGVVSLCTYRSYNKKTNVKFEKICVKEKCKSV